jgi:hypothetical protein
MYEYPINFTSNVSYKGELYPFNLHTEVGALQEASA